MVSSGSESASGQGPKRGPRAGWVSLAAGRGGPTPILGLQGRARARLRRAASSRRENAGTGRR